MAKIISTDSYVLHAEITPTEVPAGHYSVELLSQVLTARNPNERRRLVQFTCDKSGLNVMADLIASALKQ